MSPVPFQLKFIQTDRNRIAREYNPGITYIYSFFARSSKYNCSFKYIIRAEKFDDCFAIKYYCARSKHSDHKYSRIHNFFSPTETKRILELCASVIPEILQLFPDASFAFNGSRTFDRSDFIEAPQNTQRYRIYVELVRRLFGPERFHIFLYNESSCCIFVNRPANANTEEARERIFTMFANIFQIV